MMKEYLYLSIEVVDHIYLPRVVDMKLIHVRFFFFSSRRRHTRFKCDWSSDVCSSDLEAGVEGAELGVVGRRFVETHGVDGLLQVVRPYPEEGHAPLEVVQTRGPGHQLQDPAGERATDLAVAEHQLLALLVGQGVPVVVAD